ncbi:MAG: ATPase [Nitrososphaeria archaeon]
MGLKVALYSGGKDSVYAALISWPVDMFVMFDYDFLSPLSPHLVNIRSAVKLAGSLSVPFAVLKVHRNNAINEQADFFRRINADQIVAGDQAVEDHVKYFEEVARMAGASLREPLWGNDPAELLLKEAQALSFVIVGVEEKYRDLLCMRVSRKNVHELLRLSEKLGFDPIGEAGEYHTLVYRVEGRGAYIDVRCRRRLRSDGELIALAD